jgi:peptidoglycan hydrolase-like protein with peptidoglycan-binding domain
MIKVRNIAALLAISSVAALAACSGNSNSQPSRISYAAPQPPAVSPNLIAQVQTRLQQAGTYNGNIDGLWGPATEAAVRNYQQQHSLNATGQLDVPTLAALDVGSAGQTYGNAQPAVTTQPTRNPQPNSQTYGSNYNPPAATDTSNTMATPPAANPTH